MPRHLTFAVMEERKRERARRRRHAGKRSRSTPSSGDPPPGTLLTLVALGAVVRRLARRWRLSFALPPRQAGGDRLDAVSVSLNEVAALDSTHGMRPRSIARSAICGTVRQIVKRGGERVKKRIAILTSAMVLAASGVASAAINETPGKGNPDTNASGKCPPGQNTDTSTGGLKKCP